MSDEFDWDDTKDEANFRKHGIDFDAAVSVFADPFAIGRFDDSAAYGEPRWLITGAVKTMLLTVVYTERGETTRIISARRATKKEHDDYYHQNEEE